MCFGGKEKLVILLQIFLYEIIQSSKKSSNYWQLGTNQKCLRSFLFPCIQLPSLLLLIIYNICAILIVFLKCVTLANISYHMVMVCYFSSIVFSQYNSHDSLYLSSFWWHEHSDIRYMHMQSIISTKHIEFYHLLYQDTEH